MSWGAVAGAAIGLVGSSIMSSSTGDAAASQQAASDAAIAEQRRQFDLTRGDLSRYREVGGNALGQLSGELGRMPTSAEVMSDPGYQFGLNQGQQALDRKFAASGGRVSGAALKAATQFGTNYATAGFGAAYQRRQDRLNRLAALAGIGQTATNASAAAGANSANQISGLMVNQGDNAGAAQLAQGSIWGSQANQISALYNRNRQPSGYSGGATGTTWGTDPYADPFYMGG